MEKKGILLLFISDFKESSETPKEYRIDGKIYEGRQTNEAPAKYLVAHAKEDGFPINKVLCITSELVGTKSVLDNGQTSYDVFVNRLKEYAGEMDCVKIQYENTVKDGEKDGFSNIASPVYKKINDELSDSEGSKIYIDYTGGFRDISFLMTTIVRFLEFKGVEIGKIAYSSYTEARIIDITYIYQIMRLINGVDEFTSTGNPGTLKEFTETMELKEANDLMGSICNLAGKVSLCQIEGIESDFESIRSSLQEISKKLEENQPLNNEKELYMTMIGSMIPMIENRLYLNEGVNVPNIIRWCIDNSLIQQALTLYVEKMPTFLLNRYFQKYINYSKVNRDNNKEDPKIFYTDMINEITRDKSEDPFLDMICKLRKEGDYDDPDTWNILRDDRFSEFEDEKKRLLEVYNAYKDPSGRGNIPEKVFKANTFNRFLNTVYHKGRYEYQYIRNGSVSDEKEPEAGEKERKWIAIQKLSESEEECIFSDSIDNKTTAEIMRYYLAIKIIRNNLNHANGLIIDSDESADNDKQLLKEILNSENYNMGRDEIVGTLLEGISKSLNPGKNICS